MVDQTRAPDHVVDANLLGGRGIEQIAPDEPHPRPAALMLGAVLRRLVGDVDGRDRGGPVLLREKRDLAVDAPHRAHVDERAARRELLDPGLDRAEPAECALEGTPGSRLPHPPREPHGADRIPPLQLLRSRRNL